MQFHIFCCVTCFWCICRKHSALISVIPSKASVTILCVYMSLCSPHILSTLHLVLSYYLYFMVCSTGSVFLPLLSQRQKRKQYKFAFLCLNWIFESLVKVYCRFDLVAVNEVLCVGMWEYLLAWMLDEPLVNFNLTLVIALPWQSPLVRFWA